MTDINRDKLEKLRQALIEAEQSGEPEPFDFERFVKEHFGTIKPKASTSKPSS